MRPPRRSPLLHAGLLIGFCCLALGCPRKPIPAPPPPPVPELTCGAPEPLRLGRPLRGSTLSGRDSVRASCVRGSAPDCAFTLQVEQRSELRVALESNDFDGSLALFEQVGPSTHELRCVDDVPQGDFHHSRMEIALAPGSYLLAVDGANGQAGEFELFAELEPLPSPAALCARAKPLIPGVALRESTRGGSNAFSATCGGGAQGPEHVHRLDLAQSSRVRVRQQAEYDGSLYLRGRCEDPASERACNDDFLSSGRSQIAARLERGTYYVFSDSYSREQSGDYVLALERIDEPASLPLAEVCARTARTKPALPHETRELDTFYGSATSAGSCGGDGAPEFAVPLHIEGKTTLAARLEDAELNGVIYIRRDCADERSEVACYVTPRIDRPPNERELSSPGLVVALERGNYTLFVDGFEPNDIGAATLRIALAP